jgi:subtilase family serine protease
VKGDHNITVAVDTTGAIAETNESNNQATKPISVQERPVPPKPDLYVQAPEISFSSGAPIEGNVVNVTAKIRGANITQNISFGVDFLVDNAFRESRTPILNGSFTMVTFPWTALRGEHRFTIAIDPLNAIAESNETNNNATMSLAVGGPDLFISQSDLALPGRSPLEGENITINATVHSANLTKSVTVTVELQVDGGQRDSRVVSIDNSSQTLQFAWTAERGNHTIAVKVDSTKVFDETDETNNEASRPLTVRERPAPPALDLYITPADITFGTGTPVEGSVVTVTAVVHILNLTQALKPTVEMRIDGVLAGSVSLDVAAFSPSKTVVYTWNATKGVHNITISVDAGPGVVEPDRTNNAATKSITVATKGKPPAPTPPLGDNTMLYAAGIGVGVIVAAALVAMVVMKRRKGKEPSEVGPAPLEGMEGGPHE